MAEKYNIIMFNMTTAYERRQGIVNRNFFVLQELLKRPEVNRILSVDFVPLGWKGPYGRRWNIIKGAGYFRNLALNNGGELISRRVFSKLVRFSSNWHNYSSLEMFLGPGRFWESLRQVMGQVFEDGGRLIIWSYNPFLSAAFGKIKADLKIFDAVDDWTRNPAYKKGLADLNQGYEVIKRRADIIFTVSQGLAEKFLGRQGVYWLPNGVNIEDFQKVWPCPEEIKELRRPIIGYVGQIQDRFDVELVRFLAENNREKSFVFVGPVWRTIRPSIEEKLGPLKNVFFAGRKSYQESLAYRQQFDVGIIPHKVDAFLNTTNPMKMYEYLAGGKPVVSTPGAGLEMFKDHIYLAADKAGFNEQIQTVLREDTEQKRKDRLQAVKAHSWRSRVEKMLEIICGYQ